MTVRELELDDEAAVVRLWHEAGLTRPWNDPNADFRRALEGATSTVLGIKSEEVLLGTVIVGSDGHRGWLYYLAVEPRYRRQGVGTRLLKAAEEWLRRGGTVKVQLMVRSENAPALHFYDARDYEVNNVRVLSRRLND